MEKQSFELISGMEKKCKTHRIVYENNQPKMLFFLLLYRRIHQICKQNPEIQIIHFNDALVASFCLLLKLRKSIKCVVTLHGLDVVFPSSIYHQFIFKKLNRYHHIISVSEATAQKAIELGIDANKSQVITNGVETTEPYQYEAEKYTSWLKSKGITITHQTTLMMLGRAVSRKGFSWFANQVMPLLNQSDFQLFIAGPFRYKPSLRERLIYLLPEIFRQKLMLFLGYASDEREIRKLLKSVKNVHHFGKIGSIEKDLLLQHTDLFLMPNIHVEGDMEGFGLVCLEAVMQDAIVFAAKIDGIPDAIQDEKNGFLIPAENTLAWKKQIDFFAENKLDFFKKRQPFKEFTRQNYSWQKMVNQYFDLFKKLTDE